MIYTETSIDQIYLVGDLHLGIKNNSIIWSEIQEDFILRIFPKQLAENGHSSKNSILILEGDIFHSRQSIDVRLFNRSIEIFSILSSMFKTVYIILGNHDVYYRDNNQINSVTIFSKLFKNIKVFDSHQYLTINDRFNFLLLPWIESAEKLTEIIKLHAGRCQYIVCHADIQGASLNSYSKLEKGIDPKVLRDYKKIYSGHIHIRQEIKKAGANVSYTGTPYSMDKGDINNQKGFEILQLADDLIIDKFIPNTESPIFLKKNLYSILEMNLVEINDLFLNNFVEIMIDNTVANRFSVNTFLELVKDSNYKKIEFTNYSSTKKMDTAEIAGPLDVSTIDLSIPIMMKKYLDQKGYDRITRTNIMTKFTELYDQVRELSKIDI